MATLSCPNAPCPATFDPTAVEPGSVVTCPQCGTRFRVGRASEKACYRNATPRRSYLPVFMIVGVALIGAVLILYAIARRPGQSSASESEIRYTNFNVALRLPGEPWVRDRDAEAALNLNLGVYTRSEPEAGIAFAAQNFEDRDARPSELQAFLDDRLRRLCDTIQITPKPVVTWLGREALRLEFRGTKKGDTVLAGEANAVAVKGFAYFFIAWARERELPALAATIEDARNRLVTLSPRDEWKETKPPGTIFRSSTRPYTVTDTDGLWAVTPGARPTDEDPLADMGIQCVMKPRGRVTDERARADLFAFVLPLSPDPLKAAVKYVTRRPSRNPELHEEFEITEVKEPITGDEPLGGPPADPIPTARYKLTHPQNADMARLLVVSAREIDGHIVAVEATCLWKDRDVFERRLINLAGSLAPVP